MARSRRKQGNRKRRQKQYIEIDVRGRDGVLRTERRVKKDARGIPVTIGMAYPPLSSGGIARWERERELWKEVAVARAAEAAAMAKAVQAMRESRR